MLPEYYCLSFSLDHDPDQILLILHNADSTYNVGTHLNCFACKIYFDTSIKTIPGYHIKYDLFLSYCEQEYCMTDCVMPCKRGVYICEQERPCSANKFWIL